MFKISVIEQTYNKLNYSLIPLLIGDYERCTFLNCNFTNANISGNNFSNCIFTNCDFSMVNINKTIFIDVKFIDCKLLGVQFNTSNEYINSVYFENCILNLSSFYKRKLKNAHFLNCSLQEVDFIEADLAQVVFDNCNLLYATFEKTNLEKADFRTSYNYSLNPNINKIKKAKFSQVSIAGLLSIYDIIIE